MDIKELLSKVSDEELRKQIESSFDAINKEQATKGRDLMLLKEQLDKAVKQQSEYQTHFKLLEKAGVKLEDIPDLLAKQNIVKTAQDEIAVLSSALEAATTKAKELESYRQKVETKAAIDKVFDGVKKEVLTRDGKELSLANELIDFDKLYNVSDLSNESLVKETVKSVLLDAISKQDAILKQANARYEGKETSRIIESGQESSSRIDYEKIKEAAKKDPALALALLEAKQEE